MTPPLTAIILAGGRSRRMGWPKALMPWGDGRLIDAVLAHLQPIADEMLIVAKPGFPFVDRRARVVADREPESHPWVGLSTGLRLATHDVSFVCACDMPWLHAGAIRYLRDVLKGFDAVVPQDSTGRLEPFHALYTRRCLPAMERRWQAGHRAVRELLGGLTVRVVTPKELHRIAGWEHSFINLNTPEDVSSAMAGRQNEQEEWS